MSNNNPYIVTPNPFDEYNRYLKEHLKYDSKSQNLAKLCYEVFEINEHGKKLMEKWIDNFLFNSQVHLSSSHPRDDALYWQGFTDFIRYCRKFAKQHKEHIDAEQRNKQ